MAAIHGWDSTAAAVPPTIFFCPLERWPHVLTGRHVCHGVINRDHKHVYVELVQIEKGLYLCWAEWGGVQVDL